MNRSDNVYDFVRLSAALFVIYGHGFALLNLPSPGLMDVGIHTFGVQIFFCISGYLITDSWLRDPNLFRFFARRALRIFPALAVVVLLSIFVLGPWLTTLPLRQYFRNVHTLAYLENITLYIRYALPGVFADNPYPNAINGSLWTLPIEYLCYMLVAAAGVVSYWFDRIGPLLLLLTAGIMAAGIATFIFGYTPPQINIFRFNSTQALMVAPFFFAAACLRMYRDDINFNLALGVVLVFVPTVFLSGTPYIAPALWLVLPYAIIAFCNSSIPFLTGAGRWGDLSYGVYLYAFPVQQVLAHFLPKPINVYLFIALATLVTMPLAFLSWHLIEKHALAFKPSRSATPARALAAVKEWITLSISDIRAGKTVAALRDFQKRP